ncbi:MAG: hypothetical protein M5U31_00335 [Acidimicrobiia bacterium]|nr:hypothetical protein [Acidimicrobiia bacterium]
MITKVCQYRVESLLRSHPSWNVSKMWPDVALVEAVGVSDDGVELGNEVGLGGLGDISDAAPTLSA